MPEGEATFVITNGGIDDVASPSGIKGLKWYQNYIWDDIKIIYGMISKLYMKWYQNYIWNDIKIIYEMISKLYMKWHQDGWLEMMMVVFAGNN